MHHNVKAPFNRESVKAFKAGDTISLSGVIYTARDAAHKKLIELLNQGKALPFDIKNQCGAMPFKRGRSNWICRTNHKLQNGCICACIN